jgi:hypothetical protein
MRNNLVAALIVAFALIVAALLNGGIYQIQRYDDAIFRINRLTGGLSVCVVESGCIGYAERKGLLGAPPKVMASVPTQIPKSPTAEPTFNVKGLDLVPDK